MIWVGLALGLAGTFFLRNVIQSVLFEVAPTDPATYTVVSLLLLLIAGLYYFRRVEKTFADIL